MTKKYDIKTLIARGKSTFEGIPRDGRAWEMADALERQQAVVEAAREYLFAICNPTPSGDRKIMAEGGLKATLAALDTQRADKEED